MSEEATLDEFIGDDEGILSAEPQGIRLALDVSYPEEWGFTELGEVCEVNSGFTWNNEQETDSSGDDTVPVIKIGNVQDGYLDLDDLLYLTGVSDEDLRENKARENWLLMIGSNGSGERVGHCGIIEEDMEFVYASFLYGLHADSEYLSPRFLLYSLNWPKVQQRLTSFTAGSTSLKNLNKSTVENLSIPTPPLPEQRKIATVLYTVDRAIEKTGNIVEQLERVRDGVLNELFNRGLTESGNHRPSPEDSPETYNEVGRYQIPADWTVSTLQELCSENITYGIVQAGPHKEDGVPYIKTGDITDGELNIEELSRTTQEIAEDYDRSELRTNELVVTIRATVGVVVQVPPELDGANLTQGTARISPDDAVDNRFLLWAIRSNPVQSMIDARLKGTTFNEITLGQLRKVPIPHPEDIHEQKEIAERLDSITDRIENEQTNLESLQRLKHGLMQDLLSGTVRTTDTNIEVPEEIAQYG